MNMNLSYPPTINEFLVENIIYIFHLIFVVVDHTISVRHNYCMGSNILFIHCSIKTVVIVNVNISCL